MNSPCPALASRGAKTVQWTVFRARLAKSGRPNQKSHKIQRSFAGFCRAFSFCLENDGGKVRRAAVVGTGRRRPRRGWATSTKGPARPVDFCYKCVGFVKRLAKCTVLCYDFMPKRKERNLHNASLQVSKPQHFRRRSCAVPTSFCTKRSPYAFIRKNKRAFPPPYGAGRS